MLQIKHEIYYSVFLFMLSILGYMKLENVPTSFTIFSKKIRTIRIV